jgi:hypothetical protein
MQPQKLMVGDAFNQIEDAEFDQNGCRQQLARPLDVLFARGAPEDAEADSMQPLTPLPASGQLLAPTAAMPQLSPSACAPASCAPVATGASRMVG